ncbi:GNAT family N-acetyltransferase [Roseomonas sp. CCTCC AB2023176]|uniref:GNAT family N-acetyltransferase n=1 Tax=Roseomonas sp. CCTCC AB2023176 TaxID=3342640 RepID=UPI0035DAF2EB
MKTPRLLLRPHGIADFDAFAAMWGDPGVVRFIGGVPIAREAAWARFLRQAGCWHHLGFGYFALEDRETGAFLGEAGFQEARRDLSPSIEGTLEAGWVLAPAGQGRGLAEEAMRAAIGWAEGAHRGRRMTCIIKPAHAASLHVAAKLGFRRFADAEYGGGPILLLNRPAA